MQEVRDVDRTLPSLFDFPIHLLHERLNLFREPIGYLRQRRGVGGRPGMGHAGLFITESLIPCQQ